jgi:CRP-like cAMP-binding protein
MVGIDSSWPPRSFVGRLCQVDREALMGLGIRYVLGPGRLVIAQGERSRHVVILQTGYVKVTTTTAGYQEALMAVRGPGDIIGELAAMSGAERSATVTTCGRIIGRLISHNVLEQFLTDHPAVSRHLTAVVGDKLLWANRRRADFISLPALNRVASVLRDLAVVFAGSNHAAESIRINVTQPELASIAGIREVTVHKELRELREMRLIATGYRHITITNMDQLQELCEPNAAG